MTIFKHDSSLGVGGTWCIDSGIVSMKCPNGHIGVLDDHEVGPDGKVNPSVICPHEGCDFHDMVKLESWQAIGPELVYNG